jgi:arylsulfatase A-like enzyme
LKRPSRRFLVATFGAGLILLAGLLSILDRDESLPRGTLEDVLAFSERDDTNVLFILVDTLRADHLSAYGYERDTSPNIAALAEDGIRFGQQVSQSSWTKCSMASLWTGLYPTRSGVLRAPQVLTEEAKLPAELYRDAGFRTAGIWRNGWINSNFGFGQGFENYTQPKPSPMNRPPSRQRPNLTLAGSDADILRSALAFLRAHGHERWFLYLHMMDVHQYAYSEDEAVFGTSYLDIYDNAILWVDGLIGHLLAELADRGLRDRTLIVFASDHGEAFGEHGAEGHARDVYGEVTETPLILSFPFRLEPGIVVETRSANVDLWPTVLELTGMPAMPETDGRSRVPEIVAAARGATVPGDGLAFAQLDQTWGRDRQEPQPLVAVNRGGWRLFYSAARPQQPELYDKERDPAERRNLAGEHPQVTEELTKLALEHLDGQPPWRSETPTVEIDEMQKGLLRALGYGIQ